MTRRRKACPFQRMREAVKQLDEYHEMIGQAKAFFAAFTRAQAGVDELLAQDVEFFYPKFGAATGTDSFAELTKGLFAYWDTVDHDIDNFSYIAAGSNVVVEGTVSGHLKNGAAFRGQRFCAVFEIRHGLIARLYFYLDPDVAGQDQGRLTWNHEG